jgi:hypothetical protein
VWQEVQYGRSPVAELSTWLLGHPKATAGIIRHAAIAIMAGSHLRSLFLYDFPMLIIFMVLTF